MEVQIVNPLAIRAAATLANAGYTASVFQVRREGGDARVSGTNGYASISVLVPAKFNPMARREKPHLQRRGRTLDDARHRP